MEEQKFQMDFAGRPLVIEVGKLAKQASGAALVRYGDTAVFVTATGSKEAREDADFFPLTVDYEEKMYSVGKIPGGFIKREGKPPESATLFARLIDRPIRPLFPDGFFNEVQVIIHVLSADPAVDPDIPAMIGASAALAISGIPFRGPIGACRVGYINDEIVINPTTEELKTSRLDLVVAGTERAVLMVESEADILPEKTMLEAVMAGHKAMQVCIQAINELVAEAGKPAWDWQPAPKNEALVARIVELCDAGLKEAYGIRSKQARTEKLREVYAACEAQLVADAEAAGTEAPNMNEVHGILFELEAKLVRSNILNGEPRIDGRDTKTVRPIQIQTSVLPRAHGSAIFRRGETKSLVVTTLGSSTDEQRMDSLSGDVTKRFMLHYNFPPFSVGEVKPVRVSRREIGHGALAEKSLRPVMPADADFPFTVRVVSETVESNGSSSMAAVCGGCLSLMDAGIPISAPVAGVAMGLIKEGDKFIVLTDILGDEDALGDMDFKIAGTAEGVTGVQMDIKITGLTTDIMRQAMQQAHEGRLHILAEMAKALPEPRKELSRYAPQHAEIFVNPDIIRLIIGPGGKNIKAITTATGASVDIEDSGRVSIFAPTADALEKAREMVTYYDQRPELGKNYTAKVKKIMEIGAIVEVLPNVEALVHVSQLDVNRVEQPGDVARLGEDMVVKVIEINGDRIRASRKAVLLEEQGHPWNPEETARPQRDRGDRGNRGDRGDRGGRRERGDRGDRGGRGDRR